MSALEARPCTGVRSPNPEVEITVELRCTKPTSIIGPAFHGMDSRQNHEGDVAEEVGDPERHGIRLKIVSRAATGLGLPGQHTGCSTVD